MFLICQEIGRWQLGERGIGKQTIHDWYSMCREVCEIIASHHSRKLGGPGMHVELDETFLTNRKYGKGRKTPEMDITIFGIYCRETKEGLFFKTDGKSKRDLWPLAVQYIDPDTSFINTDSAQQYHGIERLFTNATHKTVNHSKGEYVQKSDKSNHINSIENQNRILKREIKHLSNLHQYMALHYYRRTRMNQETFGERVNQYIQDVKLVYPGPTGKVMQLKEITVPTPESTGITDLMYSSNHHAAPQLDYMDMSSEWTDE